MELLSKLSELAETISDITDTLTDEETTKHACVMPFIGILGYNVFNPNEVKPEYDADIPMKKGEKVDYAILQEGKPIILIEVKRYGSDLNHVPAAQLNRYFAQVPAKVGIVTDGVIYRFFSDLEKTNLMDQRPFMEINLNNLQEQTVRKLLEFTKQYYDEKKVRDTASELKYTREIKKMLSAQYDEPSEDFVKFMAASVYSGRMTHQTVEMFMPITKQAVRLFVSDKFREIQDRVAEDLVDAQPKQRGEDEELESEGDDGIVTTEEELQGYYIVRALLAGRIDLNRVVYRDTRSYFGILLDNNNRKPICRLRFNISEKKHIELFRHDESTDERVSTIENINDLDDLLKYAADFKSIVEFYESRESHL